MRKQLLALAALGILVTGCSAGSSTTPGTPTNVTVPPPTGVSSSASAGTFAAADLAKGGKGGGYDQAGINAVNALSSPVKTYDDESSSQKDNSSGKTADVMLPDRKGGGGCIDGVEFFVPDRAGTPNSTETLDFYDAACTQLARDVVRVWAAGSTTGSETVNRTATNFALGNSTTPTAVRQSVNTYSNGTFTKNGYPIFADGFDRETTSDLVIAGAKNVVSDSEDVMQPSSTNVNNYCTDSAGYNSIGIAKLNEEFGWNGGAFTGGTRTQNADGSVTFQATHTGSTEYGPIGSLGINVGTYNTACPIATPAYTLTGGTVKGNYTIPITITFLRGKVILLTVNNGQLANGDTLNVVTNPNKGSNNKGLINGTVTNGTTTIAIFNLNGWGNGTLTIAKNGNQFPIVDWNVVR